MNAEDETNITDIDLLPDGRICVFGTSIEVLEVLDQLQCGADSTVSGRLGALRQIDADESHESTAAATEECDV
jgi:hypothetical protein